jgi:hypothetical protein
MTWASLAAIARQLRRREPLVAVLGMLLASCLVPWARTQEPGTAGAARSADREPPLYEQRPFDSIILDEANNNAELKVFPLQLPVRRPQGIAPDKKLIIRLWDSEDEEYEVSGRNIRSIELFEERLLRQGNDLVNQAQTRVGGKPRPPAEAERMIAEAFLHMYRVRQADPDFPGLKESLDRCLFFDAGNLNAQDRALQAYSVLEELQRRNPNFKLTPTSRPIGEVMSVLLDRVLNRYSETGNYGDMRALINRAAQKAGAARPPVLDAWVDQLNKKAIEVRDKGRAQLDGRRYREAFASAKQMLEIWPSVQGGRELAAAIESAYPMIFVGVNQPALEHNAERLDNWSARRTGRLVRRTIVEFLGAGPEGGQYQSSLGSIDHSDDRRQLILRLVPPAEKAGGVTGYEVSQRLLELASPTSPDYIEGWDSLVAEIAVRNVLTVQANLRRPHVLPEAYLRVRLVPSSESPAANPGDGPFRVQSQSEKELQFANKSFAPGGRLAEIVELTVDDSQEAIGRLRRGDLDVIDRLFPADALRLRTEMTASSPLRIEPYALPTVHLLMPTDRSPFLANRDFRRALLLAINREGILRETLMGGRDYPGFQVVSGPFPARAGEADPLGYAYDENTRPLPYSPHLARVLVTAASGTVAAMATKRGEPAPKLEKLVIGYPGHELTRAAVQAIHTQLKMIGLPVELHEFPPGVSDDQSDACDLVYKEIATWEPVIDARRILGPRGVTPTQSPYVLQSLRWLDEAENWGEVRERLIDIHRAVHNDVALLPLWQTVDFFAYHQRLRNIGNQPVWLYQFVDQWRRGTASGME